MIGGNDRGSGSKAEECLETDSRPLAQSIGSAPEMCDGKVRGSCV